MQEKYYESEIFVKNMFEKVKGIRKISTISRRCIGDVAFKYKDINYFVEVKLHFSTYIFSRTLKNMQLQLEKNNANAIVVVLDKVPDSYKSLSLKNYNIKIFDISNILYMIYDDYELQNQLNSLISFSLDGIIPEKPVIDFTIESKGEIKEKNYKKTEDIYENYKNDLRSIISGRQDAKEYENILEKIIKDVFAND